MKHFYLDRIKAKKRSYGSIYKALIVETFGKELKWEEVENQESDVLVKLMCELEDRILLSKSPIDPKKMAKAIQFSRSGAGGCAMTEFTCLFCGEKEWWGNTAVPKICRICAEKMALSISKYQPNIFKEDVKATLDFDVTLLLKDIEKQINKGLIHVDAKLTFESLQKKIKEGKYTRKNP